MGDVEDVEGSAGCGFGCGGLGGVMGDVVAVHDVLWLTCQPWCDRREERDESEDLRSTSSAAPVGE